MATLPTIDVFTDFALDNTVSGKSAVEAEAVATTNSTAPTPLAVESKPVHFLTFPELIDKQMIDNEVINRDE